MKIHSCLNLFLGFSLGGLFSAPLASAKDARTPVILDSVLFDTVEVPLLGNSLDSGGTDTSSLTPIDYPPLNLGTFDIVITPTGMSDPAIAAFNRAAAQWEQFIGDSITVRISAALADLDPGILGSTDLPLYSYPYPSLRTAMISDATDEGSNDSIVAYLPTSEQLKVYSPSGTNLSTYAVISQANLKALGIGAFGTTPDATITFNTDFSFDFDNTNGVTAGYIDFESVAAHEIGHALGFISSVDSINAGETDILLAPLDLFRFRNGSANDPTSTADFSTFLRDLVPGSAGSQPIFDDLSTEIMMSSGLTNPTFLGTDGSQASHWKDNLSLGLMDPTLSYAEISRPNANDFRALDLIGYEIDFSPVPEVSTLCSGALLVLGALRRRRDPQNTSER